MDEIGLNEREKGRATAGPGARVGAGIHCPRPSGKTVSHTESPLPRPSWGKQTENPWLIMTAVPKFPRGQETQTCQILTSAYEIEGAALSFHRHPSGSGASSGTTARLECLWLEMEKGKADRCRTPRSRISEVVRSLLTTSKNATPSRHCSLNHSYAVLTLILALSSKERSPLSLISHCQLHKSEYQALS